MTPPLDMQIAILVSTHYFGGLATVLSSLNISYGINYGSNFIINTVNDGNRPAFNFLLLSY